MNADKKNLVNELFKETLEKKIDDIEIEREGIPDKVNKLSEEMNLLISCAVTEVIADNQKSSEMVKEALKNADLIIEEVCDNLNVDFPSLITAPIESLSVIEPKRVIDFDKKNEEDDKEDNIDIKNASVNACRRRIRE